MRFLRLPTDSQAVMCHDERAMAEPFAFTAEQVQRLTGLSDRQLRYWDSTGFFLPAFGTASKRAPYARVYSYRDLVGLRALAEMRNVHHVPLQELRRVGAYLSEHYAEPWSQLRFFLVGKTVYYRDSEQDAIRRANAGGQEVMRIDLVRVEGDVQAAIARSRARTEQQHGQIARRRFVAGSQPVLDGTRVPTRAVWEFHAAGFSPEAIVREYPQLTPRDVDAAIAFEQERRNKAG